MQVMESTGISIRWALRRDIDAIVRIEDLSFEFAWTKDEFLEALRERNTICLVCEMFDRICGFVVYRCEPDGLHMLNLAVMPSSRRQGLATAMIQKLIGKLCPQRRRIIQTEVRESNLAAQLLLRANGFRCIQTVKGMYDISGEDGYVFEYRL